MSAVLAIYHRDGEPISSSEINSMFGAMQHRVSDGQDVWHSDGVVLAHQHLWITPEEQGERQPLSAMDERFAISFDGRLDNRQELKRQLEYQWTLPEQLTDARIVLHAYITWGEECVAKLLGDFAFAVWDADKRQLFIARDPLGVRQISFYCDNHRCIVASTVAPILTHPDIVPKINDGKIAEFVVQYELNQDESFFCNIFFCPPAHYLIVSETMVKKHRYWLPDVDQRLRYHNPQDYVDAFLALFQQSVDARLRFTGKAAVMLSGGMDSTSLAAVLCDKLQEQGRIPDGGLNTYTMTFEGVPDSDEQQEVREFAKHYHLNSCFIRTDETPLLSQSPLPFMAPDHLVYVMTNALSWNICKQVRNDGIQMVFHGGYGDTLLVRQRYWMDDVVQDRNSRLLSSTLSKRNRLEAELRMVKRRLRTMGKRAVTKFPWMDWRGGHLENGFDTSGIPMSLMERTDLSARVRNNPLQEYYADAADLACVTIMHWDYYVHTSSRFLQGLFDLGLNGWDPYRDRRLVDFILAIPAYFVGHSGPMNSKWILREAMRGILPESTRTMPRFHGPIPWANAWFASPEGLGLASLLRDPLVVQHGYYDPMWLRQRLAEQRAQPHYDYDLWRCACLEIWLGTYSPGADT